MRSLLIASRGQFSEKGYVRVASQAAESLGMRCVPRSVFRYSTCVTVASHAAAVKMEPVKS
jgi:hypothetical protein